MAGQRTTHAPTAPINTDASTDDAILDAYNRPSDRNKRVARNKRAHSARNGPMDSDASQDRSRKRPPEQETKRPAR